MAVVLSMATYGVGYIARPLGAIFFGRLGDRIGRRKVLFYTIALMGAATTLDRRPADLRIRWACLHPSCW